MSPDPEPQAAASVAPAHPTDPLLPIVEGEIEGVLQAVFSVRQDVHDHQHGVGGSEALRAAQLTLRGCSATLQLLLNLTRARTGSGGRTIGRALPPGVELASDAFCVVLVGGEILYTSRAVTRLIGYDHRDVVGIPFEERHWSDRAQMRAHLRAAHDTGAATDTFSVLHGETGERVDITYRTERIDDLGEPFLLMRHVRVGG